MVAVCNINSISFLWRTWNFQKNWPPFTCNRKSHKCIC